MKDFSGIMKPLTEWTGKKKGTIVKLTERINEAFEKLKDLAVIDVEQAYPDYRKSAKPLEMCKDASGYCMGGCLMQEQELNGEIVKRVIGYISKAFNRAERKYYTIERESWLL